MQRRARLTELGCDVSDFAVSCALWGLISIVSSNGRRGESCQIVVVMLEISAARQTYSLGGPPGEEEEDEVEERLHSS